MLIGLNKAIRRLFFLGAPALSPTVELSKAGAAFAASANAVVELSDGWYYLDVTSGETNIEGGIAYHFSAGTPADFLDQVVAPATLGSIDCNVLQWRGDTVPLMVTGLIPMLLAQCVSNSIDNNAMSAAACQKIFEAAALTEDYAADGAAATPAQLLYGIFQALTEFAISGATLTVKKLDGTTTAMTFTLSPVGNPTSRTRAT